VDFFDDQGRVQGQTAVNVEMNVVWIPDPCISQIYIGIIVAPKNTHMCNKISLL
jgi:hypothetical protein